ncbi:MAG: GAF domain-containing protein [Burkholderiaceae bacterium]
MQKAPIPDNDSLRVAQLREFHCAFAPREERFDRITRLALKMLEVPQCCISIIDEYEVWLLSEQGLGVSKVARDTDICAHTLASGDMLTVQDTLQDQRFADIPAVVGAPFMRAYAGVPLEIEPGFYVGTLCVIDGTPRQFSPDELRSLQDLAAMVVEELRLNLEGSRRGLGQDFSRDVGHHARSDLIDAATGCWNANGLSALLNLLDNESPARPLSLVHLQVEKFAKLRTYFGKKTDLVVSALAQQIRRNYSERGVFCRPIEDGFLVIAEQLPELAGGPSCAQLQPHLQEKRFEVLLPSFPRPYEIRTQTASVAFGSSLDGSMGNARSATAAWQAVAQAFTPHVSMPTKQRST